MRRAVTIEPHNIQIDATPPPSPASDEIAVRVECVGICGSDMHIYSGHHPTATFPRVQGHEVSATIESLGSNVAGTFVAGERVVIDPLVPCGACYACRIGRSNTCPTLKVIGAHRDGFLQEAIAVPAGNVHPAGTLSADEAVLTEPASVGLQAVRRGVVAAGEQVVIIGAGPIGLCTALAAIDAQARVLMIDTVPSRLDLAMSIGAERTILADSPQLDADILDWTDGDGPPVIIDCVGHPAVIRQCCRLVAPAGRVVIVGLSDKEVSLPIVDFTYKEMTIVGSRASAKLFPESVNLIERHREAYSRLITHRFPLGETGAALEFAIANPSAASKVIVEID
ncbi:MAG: zinc-binding alcohol dehydrogenase family protein [Thermomicrobiales bacterium]|nr:zinc-binding alcohol dehydrogenase family protein [Thermomicrobiales bacterium]